MLGKIASNAGRTLAGRLGRRQKVRDSKRKLLFSLGRKCPSPLAKSMFLLIYAPPAPGTIFFCSRCRRVAASLHEGAALAATPGRACEQLCGSSPDRFQAPLFLLSRAPKALRQGGTWVPAASRPCGLRAGRTYVAFANCAAGRFHFIGGGRRRPRPSDPAHPALSSQMHHFRLSRPTKPDYAPRVGCLGVGRGTEVCRCRDHSE
jgi:hypothetical protein